MNDFDYLKAAYHKMIFKISFLCISYYKIPFRHLISNLIHYHVETGLNHVFFSSKVKCRMRINEHLVSFHVLMDRERYQGY